MNITKHKIHKYSTEEERKAGLARSHRKYVLSHLEQVRARESAYRKANRKRVNKWRKNLNKRKLNNWVGFIPKETNCQICNKKLYFNTDNKNISIHFDHKNDNVPIKTTPTYWLLTHPRNKTNEEIWKSCNFGILCGSCNLRLPTKDREKFIKNAYKYILLIE